MKLIVVAFHSDEFEQDNLLRDALSVKGIGLGNDQAQSVTYPDGTLVLVHDSGPRFSVVGSHRIPLDEFLTNLVADSPGAWRFAIYHARTRRYEKGIFAEQQSVLDKAGFLDGAGEYEYSHVNSDAIYTALGQVLGHGIRTLSELLSALGPEATPVGRLALLKDSALSDLMAIDLDLQEWIRSDFSESMGKELCDTHYNEAETYLNALRIKILGDPDEPEALCVRQIAEDVFMTTVPVEVSTLAEILNYEQPSDPRTERIVRLFEYLRDGQLLEMRSVLASDANPNVFHDWYRAIGTLLATIHEKCEQSRNVPSAAVAG